MPIEARMRFLHRGLLLAESPEEREPWVLEIERERSLMRAKRDLRAFAEKHPDLAEKLAPGIRFRVRLSPSV